LPGQTLGIVGLGHMGAEPARLVAPFRMRLLAYSPRADAAQAKALDVTLVPTWKKSSANPISSAFTAALSRTPAA